MTDLIREGFRTAPRPPWSRDSVRVVSWNIERGLQFRRVLNFLRWVEADLLLLQEVDLNARRTQYRDIASELARALDFNYVFGTEFQELAEGTAARPAYHGIATLSPWPLSNARVIRFRDQSDFWKPRWYVPQLAVFQRRIGGRIALVVEASIYGREVVSYNLHLESKGPDQLRLRQLNEVLADCGRLGQRPTSVIAGDFNLVAGSGAVGRALCNAGFRDAVRSDGRPTTTPCGLSHRLRAIDWIFVSDSVESRGQVHSDARASDHFPISATLARPRAGFW